MRYLGATIIAGLPHPRSISRYRLIDKNPTKFPHRFTQSPCTHLYLLTFQVTARTHDSLVTYRHTGTSSKTSNTNNNPKFSGSPTTSVLKIGTHFETAKSGPIIHLTSETVHDKAVSCYYSHSESQQLKAKFRLHDH